MDRSGDAEASRPGRLDDASVSRRSSLSLPATQYRSPETGETRSEPTNAVYTPPSDPRDPNVSTPIDLRSLVAALLLVAVIPVGLFVASRPLVGVLGLAGLVGLSVGTRRAASSLRRLGDRPLRFDLPGGVRLRVVRRPAEPRRDDRPAEV
jgi:hypothetical protein